MLDNTGTSCGTGGSKIRWNGDGEGGLVGWDSIGVVAKVGVGDERASNDLVGGSVDDRNVGRPSVRSTNGESERHDLPRSPRLDVRGINVGKLETFTLPNVASGGVVVGLRGSDLKFTLDVPKGVRCLVVVHLGTAGCFHGLASRTGCWGENSTVS